LIWVGSQSMVFQKVLVNAPFPILSSLLTGIIYLVSSQSALVVTGVIGAGGALVVLSLVSFGYYLKDLAEEDDKRDAEDRVASRDARGSRVDTEAGVTRSAHKTGIDGSGELSVAEQPMSRRIVIPAIASEVDDAVSHVEGPEDIEPTAQLTVGHQSHQVGEDLVQPACTEGPLSITPSAMLTTDETPTLATKSTVVLVQAAKTEIDKECGTFAFVGNNVRVAVNEGVERDKKEIDDAREARGSCSDAGRSCGNGTGDSAVTVHARRHSIVNVDFVSESNSIGSDVETRESEALMMASRDAELLQSPKQKYQQEQEQEQHDQGQKLCVLDCIGRQSAAEDAASGIGVYTEARVTTHLVEDTSKDEVSVVDGRDRCADSNSPTKNKVRAKKKKSTKKTKTKNVN